MRAVVQRVRRAAVSVDGQEVARIGRGLCVLVGVGEGDGPAEAAELAAKVAQLRIFPDEAGQMNRSVLDVRGEALVVSQFTLYADCRRGRRPSFSHAARPEVAEPLVEAFARALSQAGVSVQCGKFGALMLVEIHNDGPVTILLDTDELRRPRRQRRGHGADPDPCER
ncbi:MAG: D-aminoacyl-tRNA deacylase [Chloroflexia bacterium]